MKIYEKGLNNKYSYRYIRNRIYTVLSRKDVQVYPTYNKYMDISGIQVTIMNDTKTNNFIVKQILRIEKSAA